MVHSPVAFLRKLQTSSSSLATKLISFSKYAQKSKNYSWQFICQNYPLFIQVTYFTLISFAGYEALKIIKPRDKQDTLKDIDLLFTSVSASTVSSMATVEMEDFSSAQLCILTILMLIGGEVFTSMLDLYFIRATSVTKGSSNRKGYSVYVDVESITSATSVPNNTHDTNVIMPLPKKQVQPEIIESLGYALLVYLLLSNLGGSLVIYLYLISVPDAQRVLKRKGIGFVIFSVFTAVSSVANCGFTPVNENMIIFQKRSILLLLIIPQILVGNTLFAPCLRFLVWSLEKVTGQEEYRFILQHQETIGYKHLMSSKECVYLLSTVFSFIITQTILFCSLEWSSEALQEMNSFEKIIGALFQSTNARHAGEYVVDLSSLSSAILVLYIVMM